VDEFPIDEAMKKMLNEVAAEAEKVYTPDRHVIPVTPAAASIGRSHSPEHLQQSNRPGKKIKPEFVPVSGKEFFFQHVYDPPPPRAITNKLLKLIEKDGLYGPPDVIKKVWETEQATHRAYFDMYSPASMLCPDTTFTYIHPMHRWVKSTRDETMVEELLEAGALIDRNMLEEEFYILENIRGQENPIWFTSTAQNIMAKYDEGNKLMQLATRK